MELAGKIVDKLQKKEKELGRLMQADEMAKLAVAHKLKIQRRNLQQKDIDSINSVLSLLQEDDQVLQIMKGSQFVQEAVATYR